MKKKIGLLALAALFLASTSVSAPLVDVTGTWEMTSQSPRGGDRTVDIKIVQDGEKITVTMPGFRGGDEMTGEGTIKGDEIEWTITRQMRDREFTIIYTGTVEGDTMSGEASIMDRSMEWTAKKKS